MAQIKTNLQYGTTGTVQSANVADDAITLGKMASGTDGNVITYDASGNPAVVATGTSGHFLKSQGAGTVPVFASAGGDNTPSFKVILTTAQAITHNTSTVIAYNTEIYDTDSAVSSGTFTCPSGKAGKYFFTAVGGINSSSDISNVTLGLSKNTASSTTGTDGAFTFIEYYHKGSSTANTHRSVSATFDLAETDTVTVRIYQNVGSNQNTTEDNRTAFSGFKLL